ncbi:hypothetical protein M404DRAFT_727698 [Pisolithus tinctorius Marx 270]|uniref:Uncharacterized protein n=1 Tax=Pisolithus tinctorius Marx 270 TaxID=870435 RepID=A0A0C3JVV3_PISTI|nr:hypothetical protein M404DRAFT_727698 [Pisolithus tinctorius Marx 270]
MPSDFVSKKKTCVFSKCVQERPEGFGITIERIRPSVNNAAVFCMESMLECV